MTFDLNRLFNSRAWLVLSILCILYAIFESVSHLLTGHPIEGVLDILLVAVLVVNLINKFKYLTQYTKKLST